MYLASILTMFIGLHHLYKCNQHPPTPYPSAFTFCVWEAYSRDIMCVLPLPPGTVQQLHT